LDVRSEPSSRHRFETDGERAALIAGVDEPEEEIASAGRHREVADLIDDQQGEATEEADLLAQHALALGLGQGSDQIGESGEVDAGAGSHRLDAEGDREMALAGSGRPALAHGEGAGANGAYAATPLSFSGAKRASDPASETRALLRTAP
jgi:hypothetical protein